MATTNLLFVETIDSEQPRRAPAGGARVTIVTQQEFSVLEADFFARAVDLHPGAVDDDDAWVLRAALARARR